MRAGIPAGLEKKSGIYGIINIVTNAVYVGSTKGFRGRYQHHVCDLRRNRHHSGKLQNSWNKHGPEAFKFFIIDICPYIECIDREQMWMEAFDAVKRGYNISPRAGPRVRAPVTKETREKMRRSHTGFRHSAESRAKMGRPNPRKGLPLPQATREKISRNSARIWQGKKRSLEAREKMRARGKLRVGARNPSSIAVVADINGTEYYCASVTLAKRCRLFDRTPNRTVIADCCKGKYKTAGKINGRGVKWRWATLGDRERLPVLVETPAGVPCAKQWGWDDHAGSRPYLAPKDMEGARAYAEGWKCYADGGPRS